jgi:nucleoside-triphosphatase
LALIEAPMRILLTGLPGCGKTTAVMKIAERLDRKLRLAGFYTEEIREAGRRVGFRWHRLDGRTGTLAHIKTKSLHRVSKYGVDLASFESQAVSVLDPEAPDVDLFVVDEIGKMECFSEKFVDSMRRLLKSDKSVLATVAQKGPGLIQQVKSYPGVELLHLTRENRDEMTRQVADRLVSSTK